MKKVDHYICEICGTEYTDKVKCRECEKGHKEPQEFVKAKHLPITMDETGYPETIDVRMSDGKVMKYKKIRKA